MGTTGFVYDQNIVIDLEFTPVPDSCVSRGMRNEVIEIGAVRVTPQGKVLDEFRCLVRPQFAESINSHVRKLTGIRWADVESAPSFAEAFERLIAWIGGGRTRMVAWSKSDMRQIRHECAAKGLDVPECMSRWMDLQMVFPHLMDMRGHRQQMSLHRAIEWYGLELDSSCEHAALLDAEHTAELLCMLLNGEYLEHKRALMAAMPSRFGVVKRAGAEGASGKATSAGGATLVGKATSSGEVSPANEAVLVEPAKPAFGIMAGALAGLYAQMMAS